MTIENMPSSAELERAIENILIPGAGSLTNDQILERVIIHLNISPNVSKIMHSHSRSELDYRLAWARTKASKKNLIVRVCPKTWKAVG
jgi:hypothetical protein